MIVQLPPKGSVLTLLSVLASIKSQCHLLLLSTEHKTSCVVYNKGDVGVQIGSIKGMSDADKYALIQDPYVPPIDMSSQSMWNMVSNDPFSTAGLENTHGWFTSPSTLQPVMEPDLYAKFQICTIYSF